MTRRPDHSFDLVVVGASFAGLACARAAALRGLKVCVIDAKAEAGARIRTTGIVVKEAAADTELPGALTRPVYGVRLYGPSLRSMDLHAPGYYFLTTDTAGLMRWMSQEAARAGAQFRFRARLSAASRESDAIVLHGLDIRTRYLVGADGARSTVARLFGLGRNSRFLTGLEAEYDGLAGFDESYLHCFLDTARAPGYLAWAAPAPGFVQVGLATSLDRKPDLEGFRRHTAGLFGYDRSDIVERRAGLIPCGGLVSPFHARDVMLVGDAAGMVSPLTGGGIHPALRYGRRAGQLIADHLLHLAPCPGKALAREVSGFGVKHLLRRTMDIGVPNPVLDRLIGSALLSALARRIFFHSRAGAGQSLSEFEARLERQKPRAGQTPNRERAR